MIKRPTAFQKVKVSFQRTGLERSRVKCGVGLQGFPSDGTHLSQLMLILCLWRITFDLIRITPFLSLSVYEAALDRHWGQWSPDLLDCKNMCGLTLSVSVWVEMVTVGNSTGDLTSVSGRPTSLLVFHNSWINWDEIRDPTAGLLK